jgi:hypothetical protein
MAAHGVDQDIIEWQTSYLDSRYCKVKGSEQLYKLNKGTGQGGILSPTLWNFVMDYFLAKFLDHTVEAIGYADDGALIFVARDIGFAQRQMQTALLVASDWATEVGLTFSIAKTKAMIFSRKRIPPSLPTQLTMSGCKVETVEEFKYLGILFDSRLNWKAHIALKTKDAKKHIMMLHRGLGTTWGSSPAITLWLYTGVECPALTYGALVWAHMAS